MTQETQSSSQIVSCQGIFELGLLGILIGFGLFQRMFMTMLTRFNFIIPFVIIVGVFLLGAIIIFTIFPVKLAQLRKLTISLNFTVVAIAYLYLFNMPEYAGAFTSYAFENWNPFTIGGSLIFLVLFLGSQIVALIFHFDVLRCLAKETRKRSMATDANTINLLMLKTTPITLANLRGKLIMWIILGLFSIISIYGQFDPKFYMLLSLGVLICEIIVVLRDQETIKAPKGEVAASTEVKLSKISAPGAFSLLWGLLLMMTLTFIAIAAQKSQGDNVVSLVAEFPYVLLGIWIAWGILQLTAWKGFNGIFWRYTVILVVFIIGWVIFLTDIEFILLDTEAAWIFLGLIIGMIVISLSQLVDPLSNSEIRYISIPLIYFLIGILFVVAFSVKIEFDHNSWEVFFYVIIALAVWGLLSGLVALIQWKYVAVKLNMSK